MQPTNDRPLDTWTDDELLDRQQQLIGAETDPSDYGQLESVQAEIIRRGLTAGGQSSGLVEPGGQPGQGDA
jgi:hypothetical protein